MGKKKELRAQIESMQHLIDSMTDASEEALRLKVANKTLAQDRDRISQAYGQVKVRFEQAVTANTINGSAKDAALLTVEKYSTTLEAIRKVLFVQSLTSIARVRQIKNILK